MISFDKPTNLNGAELRQELNDAGIVTSNDRFAVRLDDADVLWLDIAEGDAEAAKTVVASHNGTV
jgi:hypothetical protein